MSRRSVLAPWSAVAALAVGCAPALADPAGLEAIRTIVVIYAENRSFDNLFGHFPGANGLDTASARALRQVDRDGVTVLPVLPPAWGGLTARGQTPVVTQGQTTNVWPNAPFVIDAATDRFGYGTLSSAVITRDLYHRFFENMMQADGGRNDQFAAWGDSGGLVMGTFDGSKTALWQLARQYTLADNFFQGAWGGSFLNHQYLICACAPTVPAAAVKARHMSLNVLGAPARGVPQLAAYPDALASALSGPPSLKTGNIAPRDYFGPGDGYRAVNTMQPPFQPSGNKPAGHEGTEALYADPAASTTLPPQTQATLGDRLDHAGIDWAWYAGGWSEASAEPYPWEGGAYGASRTIYRGNAFGTGDAAHIQFQPHHQPFNYYAEFDPVAHPAYRAAHLKDRADLYADAAAGRLPPVTFYKPVGYQNEHPGYADVASSDAELVRAVAALQQGPQWPHMVIVVTYDEFGGEFDHAPVPAGDRLGPGTRIPALVISPFARKGYVDHTMYDTGSVMRLINRRWSLPPLPGLSLRDAAVTARTGRPMGDLTAALTLGH